MLTSSGKLALQAAATFVLIPLLSRGTCGAAGVIFPSSSGGTGNAYEVFVDPAATRDTAKSLAEGLGGNLVTITSPAEQAFVESLLVNSNAPTGAYWFGLDRISDQFFGWQTGEAFSYNHFPGGEPNNFQGLESAGQLYWSHDASDPDFARRGGWNDVVPQGYPDTDIADLVRTGYIVERPPMAGDVTAIPPVAVPLPAAVLTAPFGAALAVCLGRRRRRSRA
jgi:hypothetical protein